MLVHTAYNVHFYKNIEGHCIDVHTFRQYLRAISDSSIMHKCNRVVPLSKLYKNKKILNQWNHWFLQTKVQKRGKNYKADNGFYLKILHNALFSYRRFLSRQILSMKKEKRSEICYDPSRSCLGHAFGL
eukprot:g25931.t1